jgi:transcription elongation factor GreB
MTEHYLTKEGYQQLQAELHHLWHEKRPEITKIVAWAAGLGDRSENADYHFNKRLLKEIDRRVRFLTKLLEEAKVVSYHPDQAGKVYFGAWVTLENESGKQLTFRIVGQEEIYGRDDYVSIRSPIARACLGKAIDDEVIVHLPSGKQEWRITAIHYPPC